VVTTIPHDRVHRYGRLFFYSITAALAGFLFGFDTVVISGAEQTIQRLWDLSPGVHGFAMGAALYGTVLGSLLGSWPADRFGRRPTLLAVGALFLVSAIASALATNVELFIVARFIGGVGIGISTVAAPLYISEIAPPDRRGRYSSFFYISTGSALLAASLLGVLLTGARADGAEGLAAVKARGGRTRLNTNGHAECRTMPTAALAATNVDYVLPLERIGDHLVALAEGTRA